jgi:hypothetical protein
MLTFVFAPWVLETIQGRSAGLFWQGRYALPVFVGSALLLGGVRNSKAQLDRGLVVTVSAGAIVVWNLSLWQQSRRWGVGEDGSMLPWRWNTWSAPAPAWLLLIIFLASSGWLWRQVEHPSRPGRAQAGS